MLPNDLPTLKNYFEKKNRIQISHMIKINYKEQEIDLIRSKVYKIVQTRAHVFLIYRDSKGNILLVTKEHF